MSADRQATPAAQVLADSVFDPFFDRVYPDLIKRGVRRCNNLHDAEDAAAEIMIEVRQRWFTIDDHEAYAYRALINRISKTQTSPQAKRTDLRSPDDFPVVSDENCEIEDYAGRLWVDSVLEHLPPTQRTTMHLLVGGLKYSDIAQSLGCTEATVRQNVRHARLKLRKYLQELDPRPQASHSATTTRKEAG